jgi:Mn-dependent DtxR family transcriptional regulator
MKKINPYKLFNGSYVPEWLMERKEISPGAKLCYARLARFAGKDGSCFPRRKTLSDAIGVSQRQADRYINELKKYDLIGVEQTGFGKPNQYYFYSHKWMDGKYKGSTDPSTPMSTHMSTHDSTDMSTPMSTDPSTPIIRESIKDSHVKHIRAFECFWDKYDKKVDKKKAQQSFKKLSQKDIEQLMKFIPIYKKSVRHKQYLKNPATFLNSRIWEDDWNEYKSNEPTNTNTGRTQYALDRYHEIFGEDFPEE